MSLDDGMVVGWVIFGFGLVCLVIGYRLWVGNRPAVIAGAIFVALAIWLIYHALDIIDPAPPFSLISLVGIV